MTTILKDSLIVQSPHLITQDPLPYKTNTLTSILILVPGTNLSAKAQLFIWDGRELSGDRYFVPAAITDTLSYNDPHGFAVVSYTNTPLIGTLIQYRKNPFPPLI